MPKARFRLDGVTIEGFKGFTHMQTATFSTKHAFLFGKNGSGKSSIVEAIRWCLFGLAERPEAEVRNAYYASSECRVELALRADDGIWHVRRRLRPGAERSRLTITDPAGKEILQSQVFPYLARMGPREGTHVIFAAQQAAGRRPQADLSDFHKVLYSYLHLEEVPDLLQCIDRILEEQAATREDIAAEIGEIEDSLRDKLGEVELSLDELLRNPPWSQRAVPTRAETEASIHSFAQEIANLTNQSPTPGISARDALGEVEQWCQELAVANQQELQQKLDEQRATAANLRNLLQSLDEAETSRADAALKIASLETELLSLCGGQTLESLQEEIERFKSKMARNSARLAIVRQAEEYCNDYSPEQCPVCLAECDARLLTERVRVSIDEGTPQETAGAEELEGFLNVYQAARDLRARLAEYGTEHQVAQQQYDSAQCQVRLLLGLSDESPIVKKDVRARLTSVEDLVQSLERTLESAESRSEELRRRTEDLSSELRFHRYRDVLQRIQRQLTSGLEPARDQLTELVELEGTVHSIRETLGQAFNEAIDRALPHLNDMMTDVYQRLTGQVSFEKIYVQRENGYEGHALKVRVGSEQVPGQLFDPADVLNGQASSALRIVPYFVFSQFQAEALELDLLLIDDPSQSFDTSHIDLLLHELANAGSHAQLIIATHEDERFSPQINQHFSAHDYHTFKFSEFDVRKGPRFAVE